MVQPYSTWDYKKHVKEYNRASLKMRGNIKRRAKIKFLENFKASDFKSIKVKIQTTKLTNLQKEAISHLLKKKYDSNEICTELQVTTQQVAAIKAWQTINKRNKGK